MLFNSWTFFVFLVLTFGVYHFFPWPNRWRMACQIGLLTIASYVFYAWHTPWLVVILAASTWINAYVTLKLVQSQSNPQSRKNWVAFAILANLVVLAFFKYASLLVKSLLPGSWWSQWGFDFSQIPLPVGISFFTFQGISLVVDIYRSNGRGIEGLRPPQSRKEEGKLVVEVAFFKAFFPQLVAGPIVKAHEFMHQIGGKFLSAVDWENAIKNLIMGYFFKMVVADNLKEVTASLAYPAFVGMPGINLLFLLYGYSFQIFADFAGYSLIAIGLARLFGYQLPVNFNFPYISASITEFWRRWHISLSTWLKEYLYIPLGGNRKGAARTYVNLIIVMLLGGLWHGAAWSYMVWGGAHGLFLAIERLWVSRFGGRMRTGWWSGLVRVAQVVFTFHLVSLLWLLFQLPKFDQAVLFCREILAWKSGFLPQPLYVLIIFGSPVVLYHLWALVRPRLEGAGGSRLQNGLLSFLTDLSYAVMLVLILTNSGSPGEFIYFQF
jgi:alginate O-acetyltransferase complex protein AlgI